MLKTSKHQSICRGQSRNKWTVPTVNGVKICRIFPAYLQLGTCLTRYAKNELASWWWKSVEKWRCGVSSALVRHSFGSKSMLLFGKLNEVQFDTILWVHNSRPWAIKILYGHYIRVPTNNHGVPPSFESTLWPIIYLYEGKRRYLFRQLLRGEREMTKDINTTQARSHRDWLLFVVICFSLNIIQL